MAEKSFKVKNTIVVNGVEIDPSSPTTDYFLKYNGTKFVPGDGAQGPQGPQGPQGATGAAGGGGVAAITSDGLGLPGVIFTGEFSAQTMATGTVYYMPIVVGNTITISRIGVYKQTAATSGAAIRFSLYNSDSSWVVGSLHTDFGELALGTSASTAYNLTGLSTSVAPGIYLLRAHTNGTASGTTYAFRGSPITGSNIGNNTQFLLRKNGTKTYGAAEDPGTNYSFSGSTNTDGFEYWCRMRWT